MADSVLSRYLDPDVLGRLERRPIEPAGLVIGNLAGAHRSPLHGFAVEFAGHREYVWGDDPKHIDWRVFYTRDKLFVKQYEMETNFVCHLMLDVSASMRYGVGASQKLLHAARLAVMLAYAIVRQADKVSLATFDDAVRGYIPPSNSLAQIVRLTQHLEEIEPHQKTGMGECLTELAGRLGSREIVLLISDGLTDLDALERALQRLRFHHHEVVFLQVMHPDELNFDFRGPVRFKGLESSDQLLTQPQDIQKAYQKALGAFFERLDGICNKLRIERVLIDTGRPLGDVLIDYLQRRRALRR